MLAVGTYARRRGLILLGRDASDRATVDLDSPSFAVLTPHGLLVISERPDGAVHLVDVVAASVVASASVQGGPCHVEYYSDSGIAVVTNYGSGTISLVDVADAHVSVRRTLAVPHVGGPRVDRQEAPHPHQSIHLEGTTALVSDLGGDMIWAVDIETGDISLWLEMPPGSGPRHMARSGDALLIVGELDSTLYRVDAGDPVGPRISASARTVGSCERVSSEPSHVLVDGDSAYVLNRGPDTLARFLIAGDLTLVQSVATGGAWPRHVALVDGAFLVANQRGENVSRIAVLPEGEIGQTAAFLDAVAQPAVVVDLN